MQCTASNSAVTVRLVMSRWVFCVHHGAFLLAPLITLLLLPGVIFSAARPEPVLAQVRWARKAFGPHGMAAILCTACAGSWDRAA